MNTTILQVPITLDLRKKADQIAEEQGFSSIQEVVRVFLKRFATRRVGVEFFPSTMLSSKNEKRYLEMIGQPEKMSKAFSTVSELMDDLNK